MFRTIAHGVDVFKETMRGRPHRFGNLELAQMELDAMAKVLGLTPEEVRQIEQEVEAEGRKPSEPYGFCG